VGEVCGLLDAARDPVKSGPQAGGTGRPGYRLQ